MRRYSRTSHASCVTVEPMEARLFLSAAPVFDSTSADLSSVPFMHVKAGDTRVKVGTGGNAGAISTMTFSQETLLGVNCLKFSQVETGSNAFTGTFWFARDTSGVGWVFKDIEDGTTALNASSLSQIVPIANYPADTGFMIMGRLTTGNYAVGTAVTDSSGNQAKVISTTATLPQYAGYQFVEVQRFHPQGGLDATYYYNTGAFAEVVTSWDQGNPGGWTLQGWPNHAPTNIYLSNKSIAENLPAGTVVGTLGGIDSDAGDTFTYALITGKGAFQIAGNQLKTVSPLNYEAKNSYSVTVQVTDSGGLSLQKTFTINVTNVNEAPTDIVLSNAAVSENRPAGTVVGTLSATDQDAGDTATYSLITGKGAFQIVGNQLRTLTALNYKLKSSYAVTVQVTDSGGLSYQKAFTVNVIANRAPIGIALTKTTVAQHLAAGAVVGTLSTTDPDAGDTATYSLITGNGAFQIVGNQLRTLKALDYATRNSYSVLVRVTDSGGLTFDKAFVVSVTV